MISTTFDRPLPVNVESKHWHERPAIVKSNLKSILVFVKHSCGVIFSVISIENIIFIPPNHAKYNILL